MVLGYGGFFGLSSTEYRAKLRSAKTIDLKRQEVVKIRAQLAAVWAILSGFVSAYFTFGGSLVVSAAGGRKWRVADRKLEMIREELERRGVELHKPDWKDVAIPIGACAIGTAVGLGVDYGLGNLISIGDLMTTPSGNSGSSATAHNLLTSHATHSHELQGMLSHPVDTMHGAEQGAIAQPQLISQGGTQSVADFLNISNADVPMQTMTLDTSALSKQIAELGGAQLGVDGALALEKSTGDIIAQQLCWWIAEAFEDDEWPRKVSRSLGCSRYGGVSTLYCDGCWKPIASGNYMHCCKCNNDEFDLCLNCYAAGKRCQCESFLGLHRLQYARIGTRFHPKRHEVSKRFETQINLNCDICKDTINQGRYFQCIECNESNCGFDMCLKCYKNGRSCLTPQKHTLYTFVWAHAPSKEDFHPYENQIKSGTASCNACKKDVTQGVFYHCNTCERGTFDLCHKCYEMGGACGNAKHVLERFNAFAEAQVWDFVDGAACDVPGCQKDLRQEQQFYSCLTCKPSAEGNYAICHSCYGSGAGCFNAAHGLILVCDGES